MNSLGDQRGRVLSSGVYNIQVVFVAAMEWGLSRVEWAAGIGDAFAVGRPASAHLRNFPSRNQCLGRSAIQGDHKELLGTIRLKGRIQRAFAVAVLQQAVFLQGYVPRLSPWPYS
jgi:hypothetical protein